VLAALLAAFAMLPASVVAKAEPADLSRLVVVGDSLSAGHQNSCLLGSQQVKSFANLVAERAGVDLRLPLVGAPGAPPCLFLVDPGPPPVVDQVSGDLGARFDPTLRTFNLSIPGARVGDALDPDPDDKFHINFGLPFEALHGLVLQGYDGPAKSQVDLAVELEPTALLVWLGANDVLWAAVGGDPAHLTREKSFRARYEDMMVRLAATGAAMVVANIPDATTIPFLTPAESVEAITGVPIAFFGLAPGDYVTPLAWVFISAQLPLPDNVVVDATELAEIQAAIDTFNGIIAEQAALHGAVLVDMNAVLRFIKTYGLAVGGRRLTTDFLGGIFTLDGIHPTNTGHAVIANEFIRVLNDGFDAGIDPFSIGEIAQIVHDDPLVLPDLGHPPLAEPFTSLEILGSLEFIRNGL
jgi:phospholipase/lecithinase/hemolysin